MPILIGLFANRDGRVLFPALQLLEALADNGNEAAVTLLAGFLSEYSSGQDDMVQVQAGPFTMGDTFGEGYESEKSVTTIDLPGFWIDRFPVTNAEYEKMIPAHS